MKLRMYFKKKKIELDVKEVLSLRRIIGLMFHKSSTENLLFLFSHDTDTKFHSFFVFFPFLMLWLDKKNHVLNWCLVKPFSTIKSPEKSFRKVVEIPCSHKNKKVIEIFVGRGKI